jgi:MEMO1 family protein
MRVLRIFFLSLLLLPGCQSGFRVVQGGDSIPRPPAVANQFYPGDAVLLRKAVEQFLHDALPPTAETPQVLVVPHAGYIFSGQIAADAYRQAAGKDYDTVVILGTNHTVPGFHKVALSPSSGFQTPLGVMPVDVQAIQQLLKECSDCVADNAPHSREHSIEVQVPFIQVAIPKARIIPVVVGEPDLALCTRFGKILSEALKNRKALIIASSDLSHYPDASGAKEADPATLKAILKLDPASFQESLVQGMNRGTRNLSTQACGEASIMVALAASKSMGPSHGRIISYANSGDTLMGESDRVVGYGAVALFAGPGRNDLSGLNQVVLPAKHTSLQAEDKKALLQFARQTLLRYFNSQTTPLPRGLNPTVYQPLGVFVTLKKGGDLRGCIGNLTANGPLHRQVGVMALQAAFNDHRFTPLQPEELSRIEIEISVLSPMQSIANPSSIVLGRDGVVISKKGHSAVFLPQVATEQGWSREEMLGHLCRKAGLSPDAWKEGTRFEIFQADVFHE